MCCPLGRYRKIREPVVELYLTITNIYHTIGVHRFVVIAKKVNNLPGECADNL
jgi:hypothetical protein